MRPAIALPATLPATAVAAVLALAAPAPAATFGFDFGGGIAGSFEAPEGGGAISAFLVTIGDTTFDTLPAGGDAPYYNPVLNTYSGLVDVEFRGVSETTGRVLPGAPSATCPAGETCVLELFDTVGGTYAPEWAFQNVTQAINVAGGYYAIDPDPIGGEIPLPPALPLLLAGLAGFGFAGLGFGRRRAAG